jgi:hypothetical protein
LDAREANKVLEQMYRLNKQLIQTVRRYPEVIYTSEQKHLPPELSYVQEKADWLANQYYRVLPDRLIDLANDNIRKLLRAAQSGQAHGLDPDEVLPTVVAFLWKANRIHYWLEEEGPYPSSGDWLNETEPWEDKGQWLESKGHWYVYLGDQLAYTALSKEDMISYLLELVYKIGAKSNEELRNDEHYKALLD